MSLNNVYIYSARRTAATMSWVKKWDGLKMPYIVFCPRKPFKDEVEGIERLHLESDNAARVG